MSSKNASNFIILDLLNNDNGAIKDILTHNGIHSSEDLGIIVEQLCDEGLLIKEEEDSFDHFKGLFTTEIIEEFIQKNELKKDRDWSRTISYSFYVVGFVIVILSYLAIFPNRIAWAGWGIGMLGWVLLTFREKIKNSMKKAVG